MTQPAPWRTACRRLARLLCRPPYRWDWTVSVDRRTLEDECSSLSRFTPRLTALDTAVLEAVHAGPCRLSTVGARIGNRWSVSRTTTLEVLRGLEHLGYIENRSGWWRDARP